MSIQDLGALGEVVGALAVVVSLLYVAYQVRQSASQIELNSRHLRASMYHATNDNFYRWYALVAQDAELASLWTRGLRGEPLSPEERTRVYSAFAMLLLAFESNFEQRRLGTVKRDALVVSAPVLVRLLATPLLRQWWERQAPTVLTPEFRAAVDALPAPDRAQPS